MLFQSSVYDVIDAMSCAIYVQEKLSGAFVSFQGALQVPGAERSP